jgi:hypothetical protein
MSDIYITLGLVSILAFCNFNIYKIIKELHINFKHNNINLSVQSVAICIKSTRNQPKLLPERKRHTLTLLLLANILIALIVIANLFWHLSWHIPYVAIIFFYLLEYIFYQIHNEVK